MNSKSILFAVVLLGLGGVAQAKAVDSDILRLREPIVVVENQVVNNAIAIGDNVRVDGSVLESAISVGGDIVVGTQGVIGGDAIAIGGHVIQEPGAHVGGKLTSMPFSLDRIRKGLILAIPTLISGLGLVVSVAIVLGSLGSVALAFLVLVLFPGQTGAAREKIALYPAKAFFFGLMTLTLAFPVFVFLFITLVGIPLAFVLACTLVAGLILGTVALGQWVGVRIGRRFKKNFHPLFSGFLGLLLLTMAAAIPVVGFLLQAVIACFALGAVALSRFSSLEASGKV